MVVTQSKFGRRTYIETGVEDEKIRVIPLGVSTTAFVPDYAEREKRRRLSGGKFRILFVGTVSARKGVYYLLKAFHALKHLNAELFLIGLVKPQMHKILADFEGEFTYCGALRRKDLVRHYQVADVVVLPSLADSFGQTVLEAMACGTPVIVSNRVGAPIRHGVDGFVFALRDVEALRMFLERLYREPELVDKMGAEARSSTEHQSWNRFGERMASMFCELYRDVM